MPDPWPALRITLAPLLVALAGCGGGSDSRLDGAAGADAAVRDAGSAGGDASRDGGALPDADGDAAAEVVLPSCAVLDAFELDAIAPPEAGSEGYRVPTAAELDSAEQMVRALAEGRLARALVRADAIGYEVCRGEGVESDLILARPVGPSRGWARVALRVGEARGVIFEAPHPLHDVATVAESVVLFASLGARALVASGTHRCANAAPGCSGMSTVCGDDPAVYRESDAAHATEAVFHRAHVALAETFTEDLVVSVHGMGGDGISVSDGTTDPVDAASPSARIASALVAAGFTDVTSCNEGAGVTVDRRLCGASNVQGRHLNGSPDACDTSAPSAGGRFVHLEQSRDVRRRPAEVAAALDVAIPE